MICGINVKKLAPNQNHKMNPYYYYTFGRGPPKPRTKSKNSPTHLGTEKREAKMVILGEFRGGLMVLFHRFQT